MFFIMVLPVVLVNLVSVELVVIVGECLSL